MLATYIGKEKAICDSGEMNWVLLVPNKEYNIYIQEMLEYIDSPAAYVYVFNKKGTKLRGRKWYDSIPEVMNEWKLTEKNDHLISQCLTTFA